MAASNLADIPDARDAWGTPLGAPLYGRLPGRFSDAKGGRFRDGEVLTIQYRTDPEAIRALLPLPLEATTDTVMVQVSRWGDVPGAGRNIHECNVMLGARLTGPNSVVQGSYSPYFYVDLDRSMAGGREFHGQPKRMATVGLETRGDIHVGWVVANGIEIFVGTMQYKLQPARFEDVRRRIDLVTNINLKIIPHIDGRVAIRQLTSRDLTDIEVSECFVGPCTAEIRPNATAPMYRLPIREFLEGYYWRTEFSLVGGNIIYDYLADK
jgi:acetoacetate decarboxylase